MKKSIWAISIILILFLTSCGTETVILPDLRGVRQKKAKEVLDELKLIPAIYYIETDEYNIDTVIKTVPEAGTKLKPYDRVELHMAD